MAIQGPRLDEPGEGEVETSFFADINITPLTDVILVLLIIFMVSSSAMLDAVREGRLDVDLPGSSGGQKLPVEQDVTVVGIMRDGRTFIRGQAVSVEELEEALSALRAESSKTTVLVEADQDVAHKHVIRVIELLRELGFPTVSIATQQDPAGP
jgi:biopolymer transport protein ExbD